MTDYVTRYQGQCTLCDWWSSFGTLAQVKAETAVHLRQTHHLYAVADAFLEALDDEDEES